MSISKNIRGKIPKITLVSGSVFGKWLVEGIAQIYKEMGSIFDFSIYFMDAFEKKQLTKKEFIQKIYATDIMLIDSMAHSPIIEVLLDTYKKMEKEDPKLFNKTQIIALLAGNSEIRNLTKLGPFQAKNLPGAKESMTSERNYNDEVIKDQIKAMKKGMKMAGMMKIAGKIFPTKNLKHARNWVLLMDYWVYGLAGAGDNHKNMFLFLLKNYLGYRDIIVPPPKKLHTHGIYDYELNSYFKTLKNYIKAKPITNKKKIGIFFYGKLFFEQSLPIIEEFSRNLKDFTVIPVFSDPLYNIEAHEKYFFFNEKPFVDAIINLKYFQLSGGPLGGDPSITLELYKKLDILHFNPLILYNSIYEEYINDPQGIKPIHQIIGIVMPELDGRIEPMAIGCLKDLGYAEEIHQNVIEAMPLSENIKFYSKRIKKWLELRSKKNSEKKIAIIIYNYPPGEDNIGGAAYLDVNESLRVLIGKLINEGYDFKNFEPNKTIADIFIEAGISNGARYTNIKDYKGVTLGFDDYNSIFNDLPQNIKDDMVSFWGDPPGNVLLEKEGIKLPIYKLNNLYICLQPSRTSKDSDPATYHDKGIPPHHQYFAFYRYLTDVLNIDAMIHFGTHGTEEFLPGKECAGSYNDYNINLINNIPNIYLYHVTNTSEAAIAKRRANAVIVNHMGPIFESFDSYDEIEKLELLIQEHQNRFKIGLNDSEQDERTRDIQNQISELADKINLNYSNISELEDILYRYKESVIPMGLHSLGKKFSNEDFTNLITTILMRSINLPKEIKKILKKLEINGKIRKGYLIEYLEKIIPNRDKLNNSILNSLDFNIFSEKGFTLEDHDTLIDWTKNIIDKIQSSKEIESLIHALNGGYIEPGIGGDPIRSPDVFPLGRNSFGFDPRFIPNSTAIKRGKHIADSLLKKHHETYKSYPDTVSVILWAFETMNTGGETIGQIFHYLGVKATKKKSMWQTELEVIPLEILGRPRINVFINIGGIFRDTFPSHMTLINKAIELVSKLDEPSDMNFVKKTTIEMQEENIEDPYARIFGPALGKYATNLRDIISTGTWESEKELAKNFEESMSYAYTRRISGKYNPKAFSKNVLKIELMSQVQDTNEYHITDLDHYYEFTGGLSSCFREISGHEANIYIADTSSREIKVDTLEKCITESTLTRSLNPAWIKGLLKHEYHGTQKVADRITNLLGLAATTHKVDNKLWCKSYSQYIQNDEIRNSLIENNHFAMMDIIKTMFQANNRGYWEATEEQIDNLKKLYLELENWVEKHYE